MSHCHACMHLNLKCGVENTLCLSCSCHLHFQHCIGGPRKCMHNSAHRRDCMGSLLHFLILQIRCVLTRFKSWTCPNTSTISHGFL